MLSGTGQIEAACSGGGAAATLRFERGCVLARTGVGVYTVTLDKAMNIADGTSKATPSNGAAANSNAQVAHTSDTVKTVTTWVGAVATDMEFAFEAIRFAASVGNV